MRRVLLTILLAGAVAVSMQTIATPAAAAAAPKHGCRPPLAHRYDFNQNGRVNTTERANARLMRSQQREWNATRRNNAAVR
jgi:hypothetical protein